MNKIRQLAVKFWTWRDSSGHTFKELDSTWQHYNVGDSMLLDKKLWRITRKDDEGLFGEEVQIGGDKSNPK